MYEDEEIEKLGDRSALRRHREELLQEKLRTFGKLHRAAIDAKYSLALLYKDVGEHSLGIELMMSCFQDSLSCFGEVDDDTLKYQQQLGEYLTSLSRHDDALEMLNTCYNLQVQKGEKSPHSLDCLRAIGHCFQGMGKHDDAIELLKKRCNIVSEQAVESGKQTDDSGTLPSKLDLCVCFVKSGSHSFVEYFNLDAVFKNYTEEFGSANSSTLKFKEVYADMLSDMGRHNDAAGVLEECLEARRVSYGQDDNRTVLTIFKLSGVLLLLGRGSEINDFQLDLRLEQLRRSLGKTHPSTISSSVKLAALYMTMNRNQEALDLFRHCHAVRVKSLGKDHELTLGVASNLAATLESMEKYQEAKELYEATLPIAEEKFGKAHLLTTALLLNLGLLYQRTGNLVKARAWYNDTLERCSAAYGEKHPRTLMALDYIGCLDLIEEKWQSAHDIFDRCRLLKVGLYDESHPLCLSTMENLASCKKNLGQRQEALQIYQKLSQLRDAGFGRQHPESIKIRASMAIVLVEGGQAQEAMDLMTVCLSDSIRVLGKDAAQVQEYMGVVGYIYALCGQWAEAIRYTNMSLAGTIKIYGENHFLVRKLLQRKAWMLTQAGRLQEAAQTTALMQAMPGDDGSGTITPPAAAPAAAAGGGAASAVAGAVAGAAAAAQVQSETLSPMQQQLQAEMNQERAADAMVAQKLQQIVGLLQAGQMQIAIPLVQGLLPDMDKIRESANFLLAANIAAMVLNAGQPPLALALLQKVYPVVEANCATVKEVLLPVMDLLGKAYAYSGNVPAAIPILEEYIRRAYEDENPNAPNATLAQTLQLMVQLYGSTQQFDKAIALYTMQFEFYRKHLGDASEPAITAINSRAMYHFALKDFEKSRADHHEVIRLLILLQGEQHPETIQSLEGFKTLYTTNGLKYE
jgi:tetratricopeptide (TPR) repeat protein